jgi:phage terminase Nu1 subunit (DNA packaging protein)
VSRQVVDKLVRNGRLPVNGLTGKIDIDIADRVRAEMDTRTIKSAETVRAMGGQVRPDSNEEIAKTNEAIRSARAKEQDVKTKLAELKFKKESGKLIEIEEVSRIAEGAGRVLSQLLTSFPARLSGQLATMSDAIEISEMLEEECRRAVEEFSNALGEAIDDKSGGGNN